MKINPAQVCLNGHIVTENAAILENCKDICPKCNGRTIIECPKCKAIIKGSPVSGDIHGFYDKNKPPSHCHNCKQPYPWTK